MVEFVIQLINENYYTSLVLIVFIGALLGELARRIDDYRKLKKRKFISSWIQSFVGGIVIGLFLKGINLGDSPITWAAILYLSYRGHTKSFDYLDKIMDSVIEKIKKAIKVLGE